MFRMFREALQPWLCRLRFRHCRCLFFVCLAYQFFGRGTFAARSWFVACQLISKMPVKEIVRAVSWKLVWWPPAALISLASSSVRRRNLQDYVAEVGCRLTGIAWSQVRFRFQPRLVD